MKKFLAWLLSIAAALFVLIMVIGTLNDDPEKTAKRHAIEHCWSEQERKSLDPASARFVAGACESLEAQFEKRYGHRP